MFNLATVSAAASAVAHSQWALQTTPPLGDPIGPVVHPGDEVALNPQPLPPRDMLFGPLSHRFDAVALNPQPLPPREALLGGPAHGGSFAPFVAAGESQDKLVNFEIQMLMSEYNQAEQLASNVQKKQDDTNNDLIHKIG